MQREDFLSRAVWIIWTGSLCIHEKSETTKKIFENSFKTLALKRLGQVNIQRKQNERILENMRERVKVYPSLPARLSQHRSEKSLEEAGSHRQTVNLNKIVGKFNFF